MRRLFIVFAGLLIAAAVTTVGLAGNVHFKKPAPTFSKNSDFSVTAAGSLTGLGNGDLRVKIDATGTGGAKCQNPGGNSKVPGQNPVPVNVSGIADFSAGQITNGNLAFTATTAAPPQPTPAEAGCPNDSWKVVDFSVTYTSVTLTVFQDDSGQNGIFDAPGTQVLGPVTFSGLSL